MKAFSLVASVGLFLCSFSAAFAGATTSSGVPNPSSVFCNDSGGTFELFTSTSGQSGYCRLDRALIEEWTFWRVVKQETPKMATRAYLDHVPFEQPYFIANPASQYCVQVGGSLRIANSIKGDQVGLCEFSDRSEIEEWTLFRGPEDAGNVKLTQLLQK